MSDVNDVSVLVFWEHY